MEHPGVQESQVCPHACLCIVFATAVTNQPAKVHSIALHYLLGSTAYTYVPWSGPSIPMHVTATVP